MIGLAIFFAVAIATAFKTPRGVLYWASSVGAVVYLFVIGPWLFGMPSGLIADWFRANASESFMQAWAFLSPLAIYGGAIGLLLLAIQDGRGTIQGPNADTAR